MEPKPRKALDTIPTEDSNMKKITQENKPMSIDELLKELREKRRQAGYEPSSWYMQQEETIIKEYKSSLLKIVLEALPEEKTNEYFMKLKGFESSDYTHGHAKGYKIALDDVRQRIERLFNEK